MLCLPPSSLACSLLDPLQPAFTQGAQPGFEVDSTCAGMSVSFWFVSILQYPPRGAVLAVFVSLYLLESAFSGKKRQIIYDLPSAYFNSLYYAEPLPQIPLFNILPAGSSRIRCKIGSFASLGCLWGPSCKASHHDSKIFVGNAPSFCLGHFANG